MRSCGLYHDNDCIEEFLKFCFMPILRDELHGAARLWNLYRILPSTNSKSPSGRPDVLFFPITIRRIRYKEVYGGRRLGRIGSCIGEMLLSTSAKWLLR